MKRSLARGGAALLGRSLAILDALGENAVFTGPSKTLKDKTERYARSQP